MIIQVSDVEPRELRIYDDKGKFLKHIIGSSPIRYQVNTEMISTGFLAYASPFLQAVHKAFAEHLSLRIEPANFWVTILQEVATMVKLNPEKFASVFSGDPLNKKTIKVRCDQLLSSDSHWPEAIQMFRAALAVETGTELVEGFFPHFSSDDFDREIVYLVSAMDAASPFYKYEVHSLCGIPEIDLQGTVDDWRSLFHRMEWLENTFGACEYFTRVKFIVGEIGAQVYSGKPDVDFWKNMYKHDEMSGNTEVSGWITNLYAHVVTENGSAPKTNWGKPLEFNEFPSGISVVPFVWVVMDEPHPMRFFSGFTGIKVENGFLVPQIGYGVVTG